MKHATEKLKLLNMRKSIIGASCRNSQMIRKIKPRAEVIALAVRELAEFFPIVGQAKLEKAHVVKEIRATFSAAPNLESRRPVNRTAIPNLLLAGDWTRSGWPATMEGAVRSGYLAAEAITGKKFVLPDIA